MDTLVARLQRGDDDAFEEFVTQFEHTVYNLAFRQLGHVQDAQDVTQEVFLRVYRNIRRFRADSKLSTWVYQITVNACTDHARRRARRPELPLVIENSDGEEILPDLPDESYAPEPLYEHTEMREQIERGLARLSSEHRQIVVMRDVSGFTYGEIAAILSLSEGTVKSRLFRARDKLSEILRETGNSLEYPASNQTKGG